MTSGHDSPKQPRDRVDAYYVKSNLCRVIYADGAWGGVTPQLNIHMALFSEHAPVPQQITYSISPQGQLIEVSKVASDGLTRDIEAEVILSIGAARALRDWLDDKITQVGQIQEQAQKQQERENQGKGVRSW